jgi:hypothetical protein
MLLSDISKLHHSISLLREFYHEQLPKVPKFRMSKSRSGHEMLDLKITLGAFSTVNLLQWNDSVSGSINR